jgi:hypothetical protein
LLAIPGLLVIRTPGSGVINHAGGIAGHRNLHTHIIDTHDEPVIDAVWALFVYAWQRCGPVTSMIERDDKIAPLPGLPAELDTMRSLVVECRWNTVPIWQAVTGGRAAPRRGRWCDKRVNPTSRVRVLFPAGLIQCILGKLRICNFLMGSCRR